MSDRPGTPPDPGDVEVDAVEGGLTGMVIRGVGLSGLGFLLAQVLTFGFYVALARLATPDDFGEFAAAGIVTNVGLLFTESGMLAALIHRRERIEEAASTAVVSTAAGGLLFSLLALAAAPAIGAFFDSDRIGALSAALSGILFVRSLQVVPEAMLQRRFSFVRRTIVEPVQVVAFGVAAVIATSNGLGPWGLVIGYYAAAATDVVLSWALVRWRPKLRLASIAVWRELIGYGRHVLASNLVLRVGDEIPTVLLGRFVGQAPLGQYRYAKRIASTPLSLILSGAAYVVFPAFARISHDRERFVAAFTESLRWFAALAMPLSLILIPLGVPLAVVCFGEVWRDAGEAAMALSGFAAAASLVSISSEALKAEGRPDLLSRIHLVSFGAATVAMVALLGYDLVGVAAGMSIGLIVGAVYALVKLGGVLEIGLGTIFTQLWPPTAAALVMAAALLPLDRLVLEPDSQTTLVGACMLLGEGALAVLIYVGVLVVLAPGTVASVRSLVAAARKRGSGAATASAGEALT